MSGGFHERAGPHLHDAPLLRPTILFIWQHLIAQISSTASSIIEGLYEPHTAKTCVRMQSRELFESPRTGRILQRSMQSKPGTRYHYS